MGQALEGRLHIQAGHVREVNHEPLHPLQDILRSDEGSLDVDLGEFGLAVGPQILVAEAARDLEVAVETGRHEDLLVDLRALRERVELPRMQTAGHQEVAGALRHGLGQDRGLDLEKAQPVQVVAGLQHDPVAQLQRGLHGSTAQIQMAVAKPQLFGRRLLSGALMHRDGGRFRLSQQLEAPGLKLHRARRHLRIAGFRGPTDDFAPHRDHVFGAEPARSREGFLIGPVRAEGDLHDPRAVAHVHENDAPQVAAAMYPACEAMNPARVFLAQASRHAGTEGSALQCWFGHVILRKAG